ncbi:MAG: transporter substrate-binding domain-containing protein [Chthoniobacteraceae bacterium]
MCKSTAIMHHFIPDPARIPAPRFGERKPGGALHTLSPGVLTIGAYRSFAPVVWAEAGTAQGKDIHFLRAFARAEGLAVEVRFFEFDRLWERPLRRQVDLAAGGIAPTPRRHPAGLAWSLPYHTVQRSLVIRKEDSAHLRTMADFARRTIAVTRGSTADLDTRRRKPDTARIVYFERQEDAVRDLFDGRIDAFGTGDICSHHLAAEHADRLAVSDVHATDTAEHFAFAMEETSDLLAPLNQFIEKNRARYATVPPACEWSDYVI